MSPSASNYSCFLYALARNVLLQRGLPFDGGNPLQLCRTSMVDHRLGYEIVPSTSFHIYVKNLNPWWWPCQNAWQLNLHQIYRHACSRSWRWTLHVGVVHTSSEAKRQMRTGNINYAVHYKTRRASIRLNVQLYCNLRLTGTIEYDY